MALVVWVYLLAAHGRFWQAGPMLSPERPVRFPSVTAVVPARDEAAVIGRSVPTCSSPRCRRATSRAKSFSAAWFTSTG